MRKKILLISIILLLSQSQATFCQNSRMFGVTIDGVNNINNIVNTLKNHRYKMTTRIVFDEWVPANEYITSVNKLDSVTLIMGELLDSYYVNDYSIAQYKARTDEYYSALGNKVDIWEIGNEVNGEWLGQTDSVIAKIEYAYQKAKLLNYKTALTLYYNKNCYENPNNEMFRWANNNISAEMKTGLDYVWISYYEDDCNNLQPNWQQVFDSLHVIFPNSKIGIGECGTKIKRKKESYIDRYYKMKVSTPKFVGGYFWWYYRQDCVPWNSKPLWRVIEDAIRASVLLYNADENKQIKDGDSY
ncbi:MAG: hypothetical protein IT280_04605 [Ignavibacteria bacterium]|nr:hypothetical protein [Ignavibacteria bacterium]